jgi:hypothetical protein
MDLSCKAKALEDESEFESLLADGLDLISTLISDDVPSWARL